MSVNNQPTTSVDSKSSTSTAPEGRLGNGYKDAVSQVLEKFLAYLRYSVFKSKYAEIYQKCEKEDRNQLKDLHKQLVEQLRATISADLKNLSDDSTVFSSLKSLDDLVTKQKDRTEDVWRPSGNPENDIRDHIFHQKYKHKKCLEFLLETYLVENNMLEEKVEQNHAEILRIRKELDDDNQEVQSSFAALNALNRVKLSEDLHIIFRSK